MPTAAGTTAPPSDSKLAVDFLRHQRTAYDWQLNEVPQYLFGLEPIDEDGENPMETFFDDLQNSVHQVVLDKNHEAIKARYPELAVAISARRESSDVRIGGQNFRVGRQQY